jgi:CheY-like chemotaxis protein
MVAAIMTVLIVEDDRAMRQLIRRMIHDLVENLYECSSGGEAVVAYRTHRPDWVLMDIRMDGVDGLTATLQIITAWPEARVVIVTGYDDGSLRDAAREAGACHYVLKDDLHVLRSILTAP